MAGSSPQRAAVCYGHPADPRSGAAVCAAGAVPAAGATGHPAVRPVPARGSRTRAAGPGAREALSRGDPPVAAVAGRKETLRRPASSRRSDRPRGDQPRLRRGEKSGISPATSRPRRVGSGPARPRGGATRCRGPRAADHRVRVRGAGGAGGRGGTHAGGLTHADAATRRSFACCRLSPTAPPRPIPALDGSHRPDQWDCRPEEGVLLLAGRRRGPPRAAAGGARGAAGGPAGSGLCGHSAGASAGPGRGACCLGLVMDIVWWGTRGPRSASAVRAVSGSSGPPRRARPGRSLRGRGRCVP